MLVNRSKAHFVFFSFLFTLALIPACGGGGGGSSGADSANAGVGGAPNNNNNGGGGSSGGSGGSGGSSQSNPPADPDTLFLLPGAGFGGATSTPAAVGSINEEGYDAQAIARWSDVSYQTVEDKIRIGVVAFHRNGIEKVSFSANGGAWLDSNQCTLSPSTNVAEYWVTLRASDFPDGKVEIRAIAWPKTAGIPRLLAGDFQSSAGADPSTTGDYSFILWTNANGSLSRAPIYVSGTGNDTTGNGSSVNPYLTLSKAAQTLTAQYGSVDGCTIYCLPGSFSFQLKWGTTFAQANERFLTITPAPGVTQDQVIITAARPKTLRVHLKNVTLGTDTNGNFYLGYNDMHPTLWLEKIYVSPQGGRYGATASVLIDCAAFVTESEWYDSPDGPGGSVLVRNTTITKLKSDMVSGCQVVLNVTGSDIDAANTGAHPDIYQMYRPDGGMDNHIVYGLTATNFKAQGIFIAALADGEHIKNSAFVNVSLNPIPSVFTSQVNKPGEHLLIVNCTIKQTFFIRAKDFVNSTFHGNIFNAVTIDLNKTTEADIQLIDWQHNHFADVTSYGTYSFGTDISTGAPPVIDWNNGNFIPLPGSILTGRLANTFAKYDAGGSLRQDMTSVGAYEAASQ